MIDRISENYWQAFAMTGDPLAYLEYTRFRNETRKTGNEGRRVGKK